MSKIGGNNPVPTHIGGLPSPATQIYDGMKSSVGEGSSAAEGTIEAGWRWARARGVAAGTADDRAVTQIFPDRATDHIPVYEEILLISASADASDEDRRQEILARWLAGTNAVTEILEDELQKIDPLFTILNQGRETSQTTKMGRGFEDYTPSDPESSGPAFGGGRKSTLYPNYSGDFVCRVQHALPAGTLTAKQQRIIKRAEGVLNRALPSWISFQIVSTPGFILDQDLLDLGSFGV